MANCVFLWVTAVGRCLALFGSVGQRAFAHGRALRLLSEERTDGLSELVEVWSCISAETVKACALIGLHMMAEEMTLRSDSDFSPDLGDMWKYGCPKKKPYVEQQRR